MSSNKKLFEYVPLQSAVCRKRKPTTKVVHPKKVVSSKQVSSKQVSSKQVSSNSSECKSCSTSAIAEQKPKPKKVSKSEQFLNRMKLSKIDFCKKCGDIKISTPHIKQIKPRLIRKESCSTYRTDRETYHPSRILSKNVHEHYKNENYRQSTDSIKDIILNMRKVSLNTIKEDNESISEDTLYQIYSETESSDEEQLDDVKEFRKNNYFECHSSRFRVKNKGSVTTLGNHTCAYRFYLNSRLFPVPLSTDHNGVPRCVECHLPMSYEKDNIKGTIQAKISLGNENHDSTILLPIKAPLIIEQKVKESPRDDVMYFGIINLDQTGHSVFNPNLPENSFALKYQNGYKEFRNKSDYEYKELDNNDTIII